MKLIVGLGNPGTKYLLTRHNIGFIVIDALAMAFGAGPFRDELKAQTCKIKIENQDCLLVKPQTFMNLSGESVRPLMEYYKAQASDLLVIQDEVDLPFGKIRFHIKRGSGGHNGIKSLHQHIGHDEYARLKMGVGKPSDPRFAVADYVLANFSKEEQGQMTDFLSLAISGVETFVRLGVDRAATDFNSEKRSSIKN